jgi:hypothetical protein
VSRDERDEGERVREMRERGEEITGILVPLSISNEISPNAAR